ncbi:MAG: ubiquinone/menaquinone biosynthesis C-methylase UbiE [Glaciecola sp.]|jgi:ubiquinone/menaquinone biosynthesis C-methylase UbiE/DNA-binding transcriptional ArsR family regulator|uniref:ArsR/SmtB family transcription factor n=1 Tax=Congregibacter sp. TaxID=2744308 RepID=UPI0039E36E85
MNSVAPTDLSLDAAPDAEVVLAGLCKAAADTLRLRILRILRHDAMDVSELCSVLDVRQPALSHHLKLMSAAGLLSSQRDGNHIFYRRRELAGDEPFAALQQALLAAADTLDLDDAEETRRRDLQRQREQNSLDFFTNNASRFREQQDLIAAPERYAAAVNGLLDTLPIAAQSTALEVGPGEGWLLPRLSEQFERVIALDNAPAMLESAQAAAAAAELSNVEFLLGDTRHNALKSVQADLIVINMVLHHTPDPANTLREAAGALAPGGALLVTELCEHSQGWTRENCGDLWLGFAPEMIQDWAASAGLVELTSSYLGQRNGFKLQLRLFGAAKMTS